MSKVSDQIIQDAGFSLPQRLRPQAAEAPPPLPSVGRIVHYYNRNWEYKPPATEQPAIKVGPFLAMVTGVSIVPQDGNNVMAFVDLTVFTNNMRNPVEVHYDVPGIIPGVDHHLECWWQWPEHK